MRLKIEDYIGKFKIVSLALDEYTKVDLQKDRIDFIYLYENKLIVYPEEISIKVSFDFSIKLKNYHNYDVFELWEDGTLVNCYDVTGTDNFLFITGKCNSNCVMCPSPDFSRKNADYNDVEKLIEICNHIPSDALHITITGGEPFMIGDEIFKLFEYLKNKFFETDVLLLTNGRIFTIDRYVSLLKKNAPNKLLIAIPIHSANEDTHDRITQSKNSFVQTISGIKKLLYHHFDVEIRLVASGLNLQDFDGIAHLIVEELKGIKHVSIMAAEMTGSAYVNRNRVWKPYSQVFDAIENAIVFLLENEVDVQLYNFPLCTVHNRFRILCEKSISPAKVRYVDICNKCKLKDACGGVFAGTLALEKKDLKAII